MVRDVCLWLHCSTFVCINYVNIAEVLGNGPSIFQYRRDILIYINRVFLFEADHSAAAGEPRVATDIYDPTFVSPSPSQLTSLPQWRPYPTGELASGFRQSTWTALLHLCPRPPLDLNLILHLQLMCLQVQIHLHCQCRLPLRLRRGQRHHFSRLGPPLLMQALHLLPLLSHRR
jgi:hypothetical protein